jgi:hypothetical protein
MNTKTVIKSPELLELEVGVLDLETFKGFAYKNHSRVRVEGKFALRPKKLRPLDNLREIKAKRCRKKAYGSLEQVKKALKAANYAQKMSAEGLATSSHREVRYYPCENCGYGSKTTIWHLTSLSIEGYTVRLCESGGSIAA